MDFILVCVGRNALKNLTGSPGVCSVPAVYALVFFIVVWGCDNKGQLLRGQDEEAVGGWDEDAVEDEDVKAERVAVQAGAPVGLSIRA